MGIPRAFVDVYLESGTVLDLPPEVSHHLKSVLRLGKGARLHLFNGNGFEFDADILNCGRHSIRVQIGAARHKDYESPLETILLLGLCRSERMDFAIQKAVELGVHTIVPVRCRRSQAIADAKRASHRYRRRLAQVIGACEQCGRNHIPEVGEEMDLSVALTHYRQCTDGALVLSPHKGICMSQLSKPSSLSLLIGPEGGLSDVELDQAIAEGWAAIRIGPRILRCETAALAGLIMAQTLWGDMT